MGTFTKKTIKSFNKNQLREHLDEKGAKGLCMIMGCGNVASHDVVFMLKPTASSPPATSSAVVIVCSDHTDIEWKDVCDDKGWAAICSQFARRGLHPPSKEHSCIAIRPLKRK